MRTLKRLILAMLFSVAAHATACNISDTITTPFSTTKFGGRIVITLNSPTAGPLTSGGVTLSGWQYTATVTEGVFALALVCVDTISPNTVSYTARYVPNSGGGWTEFWRPTTGMTKVGEMRVDQAPAIGSTFQESQLRLSAGSIPYGASTGLGTELALGTSGYLLSAGPTAPQWIAIPACALCLTSSGSYADPSWLTSLAGSKIVGAVPSATLAAAATALAANPANCATGLLPRGVDASGACEGGAAVSLTTEVTGVLPNANTTAASANTASAIVARDASGAFLAGKITSDLFYSPNQSLNVRAFGATGGGTHDDTVGVQAAISAAIAAGSGEVFFPFVAGGYSISGVTINASNISVRCEGHVSIKLRNASNTEVFSIGNGATAITNVSFAGCQIDGNKSNQSSVFPVGRGIFGNGSQTYPITNVSITDMIIHDCKYHGAYNEFGDGWEFSKNRSSSNGDAAIELSAGSFHRIVDNYDSGSKYMVVLNGGSGDGGAKGSVVQGNTSDLAGNGAAEGGSFHLYGLVTDAVISGNVARACLNSGIELFSGPKRNLIYGNVIERCGQGTNNTFPGIYLRGSGGGAATINNTVHGNKIRGDRYNYGVWSDGSNTGNNVLCNEITDAPISYSLQTADRLSDCSGTDGVIQKFGPGTDAPALSSLLYVTDNGATHFTVRDSTNNIDVFMGANSTGIFGTRTNQDVYFQANAVNRLAIRTNGDISLPVAGGLVVSSSASVAGTPDVSLFRYGVNALQVGDGTANANGTLRAATFIGALTGNSSTAIALSGMVATGRLWVGNGTGAPTSDSLICADTTNHRAGFGTCSPGDTVEVNGNIKISGSGPTVYYAGTGYFRAGSGGDLHIGANNVNSLAILKTTGNLLINTTSDDGTNKLQVNGSIAATALKATPVAVSALSSCAAGTAGLEQTVNDANATTISSTVAGGGANTVKVWCTGSAWHIFAN